jgi:hypothetical protein
MNDKFSRRALLQGLGVVAAIGPGLRIEPALGAEPAHLAVTDPAAMKVGYVEEASRVDRKKYPKYIAGNICDNCLLLQGKPGNTFRPCSLFPNKLVKIGGWCSSWSAEI